MPSSVIRAFSYDPETEELQVTFVTGRRYAYHDVPGHIAEAFRIAASKGRYFNRRIRDDYDFDELEGEA